MNEYPSSTFMRRILWGLKTLFLLPIYSIIIGLFMYFFLQSDFGAMTIVICVLVLGVYGFIIYNTFRYKRKILKELYPFACRLQYGVILWAIGCITILIMRMSITDNPGNASFDSLLIPLLLIAIGYIIVGFGYRELASNKDMNGAKAAYIGCFSLVAIQVLAALILSPAEMSSTLINNCRSVALLLCVFCLYAIFDGTRALVYSVEAIEKGDADEEDEEEEEEDDADEEATDK